MDWREGYSGTGPGTRTVQSPIESLELGERFDAVFLGSFLIHAPDLAPALLATCVRHVRPGGCVLIQREGEGWHTNLPREAPLAGGIARVASSMDSYLTPDQVWAKLAYRTRSLHGTYAT